jgi:hypothetical protein
MLTSGPNHSDFVQLPALLRLARKSTLPGALPPAALTWLSSPLLVTLYANAKLTMAVLNPALMNRLALVLS